MTTKPTIMPNNVRLLRKARGITQRELAERTGMHLTNINRIERNRIQLTTQAASAIAEALKASLEEVMLPRRTVRLMGNIGAGGEVYAIEGSFDDEVDAPPHTAEETVAGRVTGLSMLPIYEDGSLLYWSQLLPPEQMVNRRCVVQLADGRIMVKTIRPGSRPDLWTLISVNPAYPDIEDVPVEWASRIDWVKPAP